MRLIDRYLFRQLLGPTLLATGALTLVALMIQSISALDLLIAQRQTVYAFIKIILLALPQLLNIVMPIALYVATLVALNRLHTEQEIVVCYAGGMSRWRVISPALRLAASVTLLALVMNLFVQPTASRAMREAQFAIRTDLIANLVKEGEFTEPAPGLTVYTQSIDNTGVMRNLFIHQVKANGMETTHSANEGRIVHRGEHIFLLMSKGSTQEFSKAGVLNYLTFDEFPYDLTNMMNTDELIHYKPSDRYLHELFFPDLQQVWEQRNRLKLLTEGHARLATPLYNLAVVALALAAIIGGGFSRAGYGRRIAAASLAAVTARVLGFIVQAGAESSPSLNVMQYLIPLATIAIALQIVFRQPVSRFIDMSRRPSRAMARAAA